MAHETKGLRLSGNVYLARIEGGEEGTLMGPLAGSSLTMQPNVEKNDISDPRRAKRGQVLYSISDPQSTTGTLNLLSVSQRSIAMNLMGDIEEVTTGSGAVSGELIYLEPDYSAQLANKNVSAVTLDSGVKATLATGTEVSDNAITWTAIAPGTDGNSISVELIDPSANNAALSVSVSGTDITVNLATGPTGTITSTAAQVMAAIAASSEAAALVTTADTGTSDGSGAVVAAASANLASGAVSGGTSYTLDTDYSVNDRIGIVRALEDGSITAGWYFAGYSYASTSAVRVNPSTTSSMRCRILVEGTNDVTDDEVEFEAFSAVLTPSGELDILSTEPVALEFAITYETPADKPAPYRLDVVTRA